MMSSTSSSKMMMMMMMSNRFSLYPVSHVPFELFEQDIELQSSFSSSSNEKMDTLEEEVEINIKSTFRGQNTLWSQYKIENPIPKQFVDYAPKEFRQIRQAFGLDDEKYWLEF